MLVAADETTEERKEKETKEKKHERRESLLSSAGVGILKVYCAGI